jgi:hypothetical protein
VPEAGADEAPEIPRERTNAESAALAAAAASFAAALVHGSVIAVHFREFWLFGLFFAVVTPLQVAWSIFAAHRPDRRRLLWAGAIGNAAVIGIWLVSRTSGLPVGPEPWQAEAVAWKDLLATYDEAAVVMLCALLLARRAVPRWLIGATWVAASLSLIAALLPGGH